jgi:hypothetical protein
MSPALAVLLLFDETGPFITGADFLIDGGDIAATKAGRPLRLNHLVTQIQDGPAP